MALPKIDKEIERLKQESATIKKQARKQVIGYILAALGLVAGLAWNDAIKGAIDSIFPMEKGGLVARFLYALIITVGVVIVSMYVLRLTGDDKEEK